MRVRTAPSTVCLLVAAVAMAGCGAGGDSGGSDSTGPQEIEVGWGGPLSGDQAYFGQTWLNGVKLGVGEFKFTGALKGSTVKLLPLDDGADPAQGVTVAQRHVSSGVKAVVANFNSGVTLSTKPIYGRAKIPQVTNASNPDITKPPLPALIRPIANDNTQGGSMAQFAGGKGIQSVAVLDDSQAFGQGVATTFRDAAEQAGVDIVYQASLNSKSQDFSGALTDVLQRSPQAIYFGGTVTQGGLLCRQARAAGFSGPLMGPDGLFDPAFIKGCGSEVGEVYVSFQGPPYDSSPVLKDFAARYRKAFGSEPGPYSVYGYNEIGFMLTAMDEAGSTDYEKIGQALHSLTYDSILGPQRVDENGDLVDAPVYIYRVAGDDYELVKEVKAG